MAEIIFRGAKINFEVSGGGSKVPLVLLHGFLEDSRIWRNLVDEIKRERQVICIDLPGHGNSEGVGDEHSMSMMASIVFEVLEELQLDEFSIAGHSMGGYVSLELLKNFPMIIRSLVLINSTPVEDSVERRIIRDRSVNLVSRNKAAYISMAISNLFSEQSRKDLAPEIEALKLRAGKMTTGNIQAALKGMKNRTNNTEVLKSFNGSKLIIAGKQDPILNYSELDSVSKECNCEFYLLENGHNAYMENRQHLTKIMHFID